MEPIFLSPVKYQLMGFGQVVALEMTNHLISAYRAINETDLEENSIQMMGAYHLEKPLAHFIEQL